VRVGDLVTFKNLHGWPPVGLIVKIHITPWGTGQIFLLVGGEGTPMSSTIPWAGREKYIVEVGGKDECG
jgi:hypothetical protein